MSANTNTVSAQPNFHCPMHTEVNQRIPGVCPKCGMELVPEGARFGMVRHILSMPRHMVFVLGVMLWRMAGAGRTER
jgi:heavy metal-binding protein